MAWVSRIPSCPWQLPGQPSRNMYVTSTNFRAKLRFRYPVRCNVENDNAHFQNLALQQAIYAAALRYQESLRSEPLFHDPYAGCFIECDQYNNISSNVECSLAASLNCYCIATRFIDDKLLDAVNTHDGPRQIVLLTDGMDTRPFRLKWPPMSILFDISFEPVFQIASKKLKEVGAKSSRNSVFCHIPGELSDLQNRIRSMGYRGDRPSIWAMQGLYPITSERFEEILYQISSLAMKGSYFFGEIPYAAVEAYPGSKDHDGKWIERVFKLNGFSVDIISYEKVARDLCENLLNDGSRQLVVDGGRGSYVLFLAHQQRLSDDQEGPFFLSVAPSWILCVST